MALKKYVLSLWFFSVVLVLCSVLITILLYRFNVGVEFSKNPNDWSGFGSYVGGVLGPLVSFVTLLAVLRTVYLQRELLDSQRTELERMSNLQNDTFNAQEARSKALSVEAVRSRVADYQDTVLQLIDQQLSIQQRIVDLMDMEEQKTASNKALGWDSRNQAENNIRERRANAMKTVELLSRFSMDIAIHEYESFSQLRELVTKRLTEIIPSLSRLPTSGR